MSQIKTLMNLGLSETESRTYITALELGESLHANLAKKAGIKRPTLYYDILPNLINHGLITESIKGKRKYLVAQDIQPFLDSKQQELKRAQHLVPELRALLATASTKPKLLFYEGVEGIKKVYFDHLVEKQPILELVGIEDIHPKLQKYIRNYYIIERSKRHIPLKMLISGPSVAGIFKVKTDEYELREVKTIDGKVFPVPLGCDIYGDNVSFTLHRKDSDPVGLIIRSKEVATTMRSVFNFIWEKA